MRFREISIVLVVLLMIGSVVVLADNPLKRLESGDHELTFALVTISSSVQFWVPVYQGFKDAAQMLGVKAEHVGPSSPDMVAESDTLETLLTSGIDGVAVFVAAPHSLDTVLDKYVAADIPFVMTTTGEETAEKYHTGLMGQDNPAAGVVWGNGTLKLLGSDPAGKKVCFLTENPGQSDLEARIKAGREVLESAGVHVDVVNTTTDRVTAYGAVESYYLANPDLAGFCSVDTTGTPVAATFIKNNDLKGKVFCAGFDLTPEVIEALQNGTLAFTIDQHPYSEGFLSLIQLYLWKTLGLVSSSVNTGGHMVTAADVTRYNLGQLVKDGYR